MGMGCYNTNTSRYKNPQIGVRSERNKPNPKMRSINKSPKIFCSIFPCNPHLDSTVLTFYPMIR